MGVKDRYNKARKKKKVEENEGKRMGVAERYELGKYYKTLDTDSVNDDYVKSFLSDVSGFSKDGNALSFNDKKGRLEDLNARYDTISGWFFKNNRTAPDEFNTLGDSLKNEWNVFSQFKTEDEYNRWDMGWLSDDAKTDQESSQKRQNYYKQNQVRIEELTEQMAELENEIYNSDAYKIAQWSGGITANFLERNSNYRTLRAEKERLEGENKRYEREQKVLDDYYKPRTTEFAENAVYRDYDNISVEDLKGFEYLLDGVASPEIYEIGRNGGYWGEDGNLYYADGTLAYKGQDNFNFVLEDKLGAYFDYSADTESYGKILHTLGFFSNDDYAQEFAKVMRDGEFNSWNELEDGEIDIYYDLLKTKGQEAAYKYLDDMAVILNKRATEEKAEEISEAGLLEQIALNVASIPMNIVGGGVAFVDDVVGFVTGQEYNPYDKAHGMMNMAQAIREDTASDIKNATCGVAIPWIDFSFGDAYQAVMSAADSAVGVAVGGKAYGVLMGMGAASSTMKDMWEKGADAGQMIAGGLLAGAAEMVFEKFSIDQLVKTRDAKGIKDVIVNLLKQGGIEASEEMATEVANTIGNVVIMGSQSDWEDLGTFVKNVVNAGIGGFLSGGLGGAVQSTAGTIQHNNAVQKHGQSIIDKKGVDLLQQLAIEVSSSKSNAAEKSVGKLSEKVSQKASARNVGKLSEKLGVAIDVQGKNDIKKALTEKGLGEKDAKRVSEYLYKASQGYEFSESEAKEVEDNDKIIEVLRDVVSDPSSAMNSRTKKLISARLGIDTNVNILAESADGVSVKKEVATADVVSKDGKTILAETGEEVKIDKNNAVKRVEEKDGKRTVYYNTDKGEVASTDILYADDNEAILYESFTDLNPEIASAAIRHYDGSVPVQVYADGVREGILTYGSKNFQAVGKDISVHSALAELSKMDQEFALDLGRRHAKLKAISDTKANEGRTVQTSIKPDKSGKKKVKFEQGVSKSLTRKVQRHEIALAELVSNVFGMDIYLYDAQTKKEGENGYESNGYYDPSDGSIHLDIQALTSDKQAIAYTLSHELTHFIKDWSKEKYQIFADFLIKQYAEHGVPTSALLDAKMKKLGTDDVDFAFDELVADACEKMLLDSKAVEKVAELKAQDTGLVEKIKQFLTDLIAKIKKAYAGYGIDRSSDEAQAVDRMVDVLEELRALFEDAAVDAAKNYQSAAQNNTEKTRKTLPETVKNQAKLNDKGRYDPRTVTEDDVRGLLASVNAMELNDGSYIPVRIQTPPALIHWARVKRNDIIEDLPMVMGVYKAFQAMATSAEYLKGNDRPHELTVDDVISIIEKMNSPRYIVYQGINGRYVEVIDHVTKQGKRIFAIIELGEHKNPILMNGFEGGPCNLLVTTYSPNVGELQKLLKNNKNEIVYDKEKDESQRSSGRNWPSLLNDSPFYKDSIPQKDGSVKTIIDEKAKKDSIKEQKKRQLEIINETNPAPNTYSTWIRTEGDIKTLAETLEDSDWVDGDEFNPDLTREDIQNAIRKGTITVYSSYPIKDGVFVSPSYMEAESYSPDGRVYRKTVDIRDVAWIDPTQGQYARVSDASLDVDKKVKMKQIEINKGISKPIQNQKKAYSIEEEIDNIYSQMQIILASGYAHRNGRVPSDLQLFQEYKTGKKHLTSKYELAKYLLLSRDKAQVDAWDEKPSNVEEAELALLYREDPDEYLKRRYATKAIQPESKLYEKLFDYLKTNDIVFNQVWSTDKEIPLDNYSETQYNNFGWVSYNGIITPRERQILLSDYAGYKHVDDYYAITKRGEAVIYSPRCPDVIMYVRGTIEMPEITRIVRIKIDPEEVTPSVAESVIKYERKRVPDAYGIMQSVYEKAVIYTYRRKDYASFQRYRSELKRGSRGANDSPDRAERNGGRGSGTLSGVGQEVSDGGVKNQLKEPTHRTILANALETTIDTSTPEGKYQLQYLTEYKGHIAEIEDLEDHLAEVKTELKELSFAKGKRNMARIDELQRDKNRTQIKLNKLDRRLTELDSMKPIRDLLAREKESARKEAEKAGRELAKERVAQDRERRSARIYKDRIEATVKSLRNRLVHPTAKTAIPEAFGKSVAKFLSTIDFSTYDKGGNVRVSNANYQRDLARESLKEISEQLEENSIESMYGQLDISPEMKEWISLMSEAFALHTDMNEGFSVNQMSVEQLKTLHKFLTSLQRSINNAAKYYTSASSNVASDAMSTMDYLKPLAKKPHNEKLEKIGKILAWDYAQPVTVFDRFGSGGKHIYNMLVNGQAKMAHNVKEIEDFVADLYTEDEAKAWQNDSVTVKIRGEEYHVTPAMLMGLHCLLQQEDSARHILDGGGIRFSDVTFKNKTYRHENTYFTKEDADEVESKLTDRQRQVAEAMRDFMTQTGSAWGNEISMIRFGYHAFTIPKYYPIRTIASGSQYEAQQKRANIYALLNKSFTKERNVNANNAVIVDDIFSVFNNHMSEMALYHAWALPVIDTIKWFNFKVNQDIETETAEQSVHDSLRLAYGNYADEYIRRLLESINSETAGGLSESIAFNALRMVNRVQVAANIRVAVQQPFSVTRALEHIAPKYVTPLAGKAFTVARDEMLNHSGVALWKSLGYFDVDVSRPLEVKVKKNAKFADKVTEKTMFLAERGDQFTWTVLWNACKKEAAEKNPNISKEELIEKTKERFHDIILRTQVVDSVLTKSQWMRSNSFFHRSTSAFMSEPMTSYNGLLRAYDKYSRDAAMYGGRKSFQRNAKTILVSMGIFTLTQLVNALATAPIDALRDDDDDEEYYEKLLSNFKDNAIQNIIPTSMMPWVSDIVEYAIYGKTDRADLQIYTRAIDLGFSIYKTIKDYSNVKLHKTISSALSVISSFSGLPMYNVMRDAVSVWNTFASDDLKFRTSEPSKSVDDEKLYDAITSGNESKISRYKEKYADDKAWNSAIASALKEHDPRIMEAAIALLEGDPSERIRIQKSVIAEGNFTQDQVISATNSLASSFKSYVTKATNAKVRGDTKEYNEIIDQLIEDGYSQDLIEEYIGQKEADYAENPPDTDTETSMYQSSDIADAYDAGDNDLALKIIEDLIRVKTENGSAETPEEREKSAKSSVKALVTKYWKEKYKQAYANKDSEEMKRIRYILKDTGLYGTNSDIIDTCRRWLTEKE